MPQIDVTLPENTLDNDSKARLLAQLTQALLKWEGEDESKTGQLRVTCFISEITEGGYEVAGQIYLLPRLEAAQTH